MKQKIGIALSGGVVRGISHIGVLKVLEREKIPIDFIAGTSIGALIGAIYASGVTIDEMDQLVKTAKWRELVDFTIPKTGLIVGKKIENYIRKIIKCEKFEEMRIPLAVIATDLSNGEKIVFTNGDIIKAVRASISMPGVFEPVVDSGKILVDGGLVDPIPVDAVKEMGADIVIAVDLSIDIKQSTFDENKEESKFTEFFEREFVSTEISYLKDYLRNSKIKLPFFVDKFLSTKRIMGIITSKEVPDIVKYTIRSLDILSEQFTKEKLKYPYTDVVIKPEFHGVRWTEFDKTEQCIKSGEMAAEESIPKLKRLLET